MYLLKQRRRGNFKDLTHKIIFSLLEFLIDKGETSSFYFTSLQKFKVGLGAQETNLEGSSSVVDMVRLLENSLI